MCGWVKTWNVYGTDGLDHSGGNPNPLLDPLVIKRGLVEHLQTTYGG